jgi:hypothetical protein
MLFQQFGGTIRKVVDFSQHFFQDTSFGCGPQTEEQFGPSPEFRELDHFQGNVVVVFAFDHFCLVLPAQDSLCASVNKQQMNIGTPIYCSRIPS